jgi:hypothetical protein
MNTYGRLVQDHHRRHRPHAYSQIPDPDELFAEAGEEIQAAVTALRGEILGPQRPGENLEAYRLRSYQALAVAEELTLADHHLLQPDPEPETEDWSDDPQMERHYRHLAEINQAINTPL